MNTFIMSLWKRWGLISFNMKLDVIMCQDAFHCIFVLSIMYKVKCNKLHKCWITPATYWKTKSCWWNFVGGAVRACNIQMTLFIIEKCLLFGERIENARKQHDVSTMAEQWPRHGNFTIRSTRRNTNEMCPFSEFKHQQSTSSSH